MQGYYGIGEVFVKVANLERAAGFYRDLLGFEVVERNNRQLYIYLESGHLVLNEPTFLGSLPERLKPLFDNWLKFG